MFDIETIIIANLVCLFCMITVIIMLYRKIKGYKKTIDILNKKCKNCLWKRTELRDDE